MHENIYVVFHSRQVVGEEPEFNSFGAYRNKDQAYKQAKALDKLASKDENESYWVGVVELQ